MKDSKDISSYIEQIGSEAKSASVEGNAELLGG